MRRWWRRHREGPQGLFPGRDSAAFVGPDHRRRCGVQDTILQRFVEQTFETPRVVLVEDLRGYGGAVLRRAEVVGRARAVHLETWTLFLGELVFIWQSLALVFRRQLRRLLGEFPTFST